MQRHTIRRTVAAVTLLCAGLYAVFGAPTVARAQDGRPGSRRGDQPRSFVYTLTNPDGPNEVVVFARDSGTDHLTHLGREETGGVGDPFIGGFSQHAVVSDGKFLYAVNAGGEPEGTVSAFRINKDGTLDLLNVVPSGGRRPASLALTRGLLYVANQGSIPGEGEGIEGSYSGFRINRDGSLVPIPGSTVTTPADSSPADILFTADGRRLVATQLVGNQIDSFLVDRRTGQLTNRETVEAGGGPFGAAFSPKQKENLFVTLAIPEVFGPPAPGVGSYQIEKKGAGLTLVENETVESSVDPCWIEFTKDGRFFWVDTFIPRVLFLFSAEKDGSFSLVSQIVGRDDTDVPAGTIVGATDIAISPDDRHFYQLRAFSVPDAAVPVSPRIHVYQVTENWEQDAGLAFVESVIVPGDDLPDAGTTGLVVVDRNKASD